MTNRSDKPEFILIGSQALFRRNRDFKPKVTTDWDIISPEPVKEFGAGTYEWHDRNFLNNASFDDFCTPTPLRVGWSTLYCMDLAGLAIIKRSHLWRDLAFDKHITMYHRFINFPRSLWTPHMEALYQERLALTKAAFPQRQPNLMQPTKDFFDDAVKKIYEHDYLHELVAFYKKPLYTRLLRSPELAWCDEDKWNNLTDTEKDQCVVEETMVIAIERFLLPGGWQMPPKLAYMKALRKVCTTLCSGWFRDWAIDRYPQVVGLFDKSTFDKVQLVLSKENKGD